MTEHKYLKRRVRARMSRTGERYTAARRQVLARTAEAPKRLVPPPGMTADDKVAERTGKRWADWIAILDEWGAAERPHPEIARWLEHERGVDGWWAQQITVGYEIAIGRRVVGQRGDTFSATATKTVGVPVARLFAAWQDASERERWLPGAHLRLRTAQDAKSIRYDWEDGTSRVIVGFEPKGDDRSVVALEHERLPDAEASVRLKAFWRERLVALKELLEG